MACENQTVNMIYKALSNKKAKDTDVLKVSEAYHSCRLFCNYNRKVLTDRYRHFAIM